METKPDMDLVELDAQGWILAPRETPEALICRKKIAEKKREDFLLNSDSLSKAHKITQDLYQFTLKEALVLYSDKSLSLWEGAVLWAYFDENGDSYPVIQMRTNYKKGFLRFYKEEEILAHELVHAARFAFKEPFFEEMLAYKTSKNFFPRFFGPLFIFRLESFLFLGLIIMSFLGFAILEWTLLLWLPFLFLACLLLRLVCLHSIFSLAKAHLKKVGTKEPLAALLRFSDKEIWQSALIRLRHIKKKWFSKF